MYPHAQQIDGRREVMPKLDQSREDVIGRSKPFPLFLVQAFWVLMIFEVDWFLYEMTGAPLYRLPMLVVPVLALLVIFNRNDKRLVYWPLILFVLLHLGASVFAENAGYARGAFKFMLYMTILLASSVTFLDTPSKMISVLKLYLLSFAWFGVQGIPGGRVVWHPLIANEDSYGPLMVISISFSYYFALATSSRRWRWIARGIFFLSVLGLMVSFARGAALAGTSVLLYLVMRSPHKFRTIAGLTIAAALLLSVAAMIFPLDSYIAEIQSSSEGDLVRETLWRLAWNVFQQSPVYGVGAANFGIIAAKITDFDSIRGVWSDPAQLYNMGVHNAYFQILVEEGIIGIMLWIVMIFGFFRRTMHIEAAGKIVPWRGPGGDTLDMRMISRGLEGAMIGYLASGFFYNQLYIHWFWSLVTIAYVLGGLASPSEQATKSNAGENLSWSSQIASAARPRV